MTNPIHDAIESKLYASWRRKPSPQRVADELEISRDTVKKLCRVLDLPMVNEGIPGGLPRWRIPVESFRALCAHLAGSAGEAVKSR